MENEETQDYSYRKSPWRFLFAAFALYGFVELLGSLAAWLLYRMCSDPCFAIREATSIGIIGGADGPTAIFVTTPAWTGYVVPALCLVIGIFGYLHLRKCKQK